MQLQYSSYSSNLSKGAGVRQGTTHREAEPNVKRRPSLTKGIEENVPCPNLPELNVRLLMTRWEKGFSSFIFKADLKCLLRNKVGDEYILFIICPA